MEKTIKILNELESQGLLDRYAIGGAMAAAFYMEPSLTYDLDVFIATPQTAGSIMMLSPIYEFLRSCGCVEAGEHIVIEGVPVQFLPVHNPLTVEALREAREILYRETPARVLRAEHLMAIMLQTYRPKDKVRLTQMLDQAQVDKRYFTEILERHGLATKWAESGNSFGVE